MEDSLVIIGLIIINMVVAMFWYSPKLFGRKWAKAYGFRMDQMKVSPKHYLGAICVTAVMVIVTAILVRYLRIHAFMEALEIGFLFWLGFIATSHFSGVIWAKKPLKAYYIEVSYLLLITVVNTVALTHWL